MDPVKIQFNALIVGLPNSGKTQFLVNQLCGPFNGRFDYILICPTFAYNRTLYRLGERDPWLYVTICKQHQVEAWLKVASFAFEGTSTLIILDDCAASKDVKGGQESWSNLAFQRAIPASVCGSWHKSSPAFLCLSDRTWQQSLFFTCPQPRP